MILVRAPLRISFLGGGTDLPGFYRKFPGRVISATIDKFTYAIINSTPLIDKLVVKYQKTEVVSHPRELEHPSIKAALLDLNITGGGIEIGSFADLPSRAGLGSSSSFAVTLLKGLHGYLNRKLSKDEAAELACNLEINLLKEPIGKQDQYASAFGGLNIFQFNPDDSVEVKPVFLDYKKKLSLENHLLLFFTGLTRYASSILTEQQSGIDKNLETYKNMADSVFDFQDKTLAGDIKGMAEMLHEGWLRKKSLASCISNSVIDSMYDAGMSSGAWGGKVLGAGGGGCILFFVPPDKQNNVRRAMRDVAVKNNIEGFKEIPFKFVQSGAETLFDYKHIS